MHPTIDRRHRGLLAGAAGLACAALLLGTPGVGADELRGTNVRLLNPTFSGGGGTLTNPGSGATATADTTIGQSGPIGVSRGPSGVTLEAGVWHTTFVPEPARALLAMAALTTLALLSRLTATDRRRRRRMPHARTRIQISILPFLLLLA